jgi:hypothetical protein
MKGPHDEELELEGGHAAERLREFLAKRFPPGASVDEISAAISKKEDKEHPGREDEDEACRSEDDRHNEEPKKSGD